MTTTTKMPAARPAAVARLVPGVVGAVGTTVPGSGADDLIGWHGRPTTVCGNPATFKRLHPGRLGATT